MSAFHDLHRCSRLFTCNCNSAIRKDYMPMDEKKISLKLKHISQSYIVDNKVFDAVVDVSLDVYKSEFLVVLGPGRCGKTVLLNMIAGLEKPVDGEILLDGEALKGSDERIGMMTGLSIIWRLIREILVWFSRSVR